MTNTATKQSPETLCQAGPYKKLQASEREIAHYVADMILELRNLSKAGEMDTLRGLLEIAYYEAFSAANRIPIPEGEAEHLVQLSSDARQALLQQR